MAWSWFKKFKPAQVERRAATAQELQTLLRLSGESAYRRAAVSLLLAFCASIISGTVAAASRPSAMTTGIVIGSFSMAAILFVVLLVVAILSLRAMAKAAKILKVADPMLSPVVPITEGDRAGGWVVLDADTDRLHVARAQSLAAFKMSRFGALLGSIGVTIGIVAAAIAMFSAPKPKYTVIKGLFFALGGVWWLARFAFARSAYQWTIEEGEVDGVVGRAIVMQDAALFGKSHLLTVKPSEIANFAATTREISIVLRDGTVRPLGGLGGGMGGGPLASWRAACIASTVAGMLDIRIPLVYTDERKQIMSMLVPGELAEDIDVSPSTEPGSTRASLA
jgi:hypothetical protein